LKKRGSDDRLSRVQVESSERQRERAKDIKDKEQLESGRNMYFLRLGGL